MFSDVDDNDEFLVVFNPLIIGVFLDTPEAMHIWKWCLGSLVVSHQKHSVILSFNLTHHLLFPGGFDLQAWILACSCFYDTENKIFLRLWQLITSMITLKNSFSENIATMGCDIRNKGASTWRRNILDADALHVVGTFLIQIFINRGGVEGKWLLVQFLCNISHIRLETIVDTMNNTK